MEATTAQAETAGLTTHYHRAGEGNARRLVLLHGGGPGADAQSNWRAALERFGESFDVIAPDLAGFGQTTHPAPPPDGPKPWIDVRVEQVVALLDGLGWSDDVALVGNSLGGGLTLHLLRTNPERFAAAVLMGTAGTPVAPTDELIELVTFYERGDQPAMRRLMDLFMYDPSVLGEDLDALAEARLEAASRPEIRRSYEAMFPPRPDAMKAMVLSDEDLAAMHHPILLVHGRDDLMIPLAASQHLLERLPRVDLHVFGNCGHWAQLERAGEFERVISDFLLADRRETARLAPQSA